MPEHPVVRIARPTDHLPVIATMYQRGLGLSVLASFTDHDGFDGVMLGFPGNPYHLEFTTERGRRAGGAPSPEHLLVVYLEDTKAWEAGVQRMLDAGFKPVLSHNPYWDRRGRTFEDVEGYRIVLQNSAWTL